VTQYAYNPLDELTSEIVLGADTTLYTYDPMGNRASVTHNGVATAYTYDLADRLAAAGTVTYAYDENGNRISRVEGSSTSSYAYDYENRLTQISGPEGVSKYSYDGLGRRIRSEEPGRIRRYALDPTSKPYRTLRETNDAGATQVSYVHGDGLTSDISPTGATRYFHFDGLGSTAAITDSVGNDVGHLGFGAFGDAAIALGQPATRQGFVGRYGVEAAVDQYVFMRDRFYDPASGSFLSTDPESGQDNEYLSVVLFAYAGANPVNTVDPDGRLSWSVTKQLLRTGLSIGRIQVTKAVSPSVRFIDTKVTFAPSATTTNLIRGGGALLSAGMQVWSDKVANTPMNYRPLRATVAAEESVPIGIAATAVTGVAGPVAGVATGVALGKVADVVNKKALFPATDWLTNKAIVPISRPISNFLYRHGWY
jgi:RHS repeat-associated protein